jgi:hypothetical protein
MQTSHYAAWWQHQWKTLLISSIDKTHTSYLYVKLLHFCFFFVIQTVFTCSFISSPSINCKLILQLAICILNLVESNMDLSNTLASLQMLQRICNPKILRYVEIFTVLGNFQYNEKCPYLIVPVAEYNVNCICRTCNTVKCLQLIFGEADLVT